MTFSYTAPCGTSIATTTEAAESWHPKQLDRFRDRYFPAGAKDDGRNAFVLAGSLRTDQHCFRAVRVSDPGLIRLRELWGQSMRA